MVAIAAVLLGGQLISGCCQESSLVHSCEDGRKERGVRDWVCHQSLTSALTFSLQTEGTRLQKDLRTYLASVKGRRQAGRTWPM